MSKLPVISGRKCVQGLKAIAGDQNLSRYIL